MEWFDIILPDEGGHDGTNGGPQNSERVERGVGGGWESSLSALCPSEVHDRARDYLRGLLSAAKRKNGWQLAEVAGNTIPYGLQHLLGWANWDADLVRDDLRGYVTEHLGDENAVLVVDETGFIKEGTSNVGVKRQYTGTAGKTENCQVGVFLAYASRRGQAFVDRELYLPEEWAQDQKRRERAGVPEEVGMHTKPLLAQEMLERALDGGVRAAWVVADSVYGEDTKRRLGMFLEERKQPYVLAVSGKAYVWAGLASIASARCCNPYGKGRFHPKKAPPRKKVGSASRPERAPRVRDSTTG